MNFIRYCLSLPGRAFRKVYYKYVEGKPEIDRFFRYRAPKKYWQKRGGERYFQEQEAVHERTLRSEFIASKIRNLAFKSILEIGSGYGKQLRNLAQPGIFFAGCDFSHNQLLKAKAYFPELAFRLIEADAEQIPFQNKTFDAVFSSAVILHNEYEKARKIVSEMIRVARKYLIHNEDIDVSFSRYGYDLKATYERLNFNIISCKQFPFETEPEKTQFTIVELPSLAICIKPELIPLQYSSYGNEQLSK